MYLKFNPGDPTGMACDRAERALAGQPLAG
jgi:hypothetical protein